MRFIDIFQDNKCISIYSEINDYVSSQLKVYNDFLEINQLSYKGKDIFDSIWGTIELSPIEVYLIDSPLIQRLKNIKQLGYAYQVYCAADYSRFAHTIGVIEASSRIANMISNKLPIIKEGKINFVEIVRLAAIMHDSGHMFFSHVSEKFFVNNERFARNQEVKDALNHFNEKISDRAAFHEMLSVMIVNSEEFYRFLDIVYFEKSLSREERHAVIDYISGLIVGVAIDKKVLPYSHVIKGTIDADRMDYLSRDSYTTKVPLAVDIARLINKISIIKKSKFNPSQVWNDDRSGPYFAMAIQYSAQRLVWQLSMTRTILYQNIYFHHKKLTAESILNKALEYIFALFSEEQLSFTYISSLIDAVFGEYFAEILIPEHKRNCQTFIEAKTLMESLRNRSFYKRVSNISQETVKTTNNTMYEIFKTRVVEDSFSAKHKVFIEGLSQECVKLANLLSINTFSNTPKFMFIQASWNWDAEEGIPSDLGDGNYKMSSELFKATPVIGEENKQKQYYLLTDQTHHDVVYLALEKYLYCEKRFRLTNAAYSCAKITSDHLNRLRKRLMEKGYYDGCLELIPDNLFLTLIDSDLFEVILKKYKNFTGADNSEITRENLTDFLRQFLYSVGSHSEMHLLLDGILRLLNSATFISRNYFTNNMSKLMDKILLKEFENYYVVTLGGCLDSSHRLYWFFNEIKSSPNYKFIDSVELAIKLASQSNSCICFFDDGAYSGKQVVSIFQELFGIPTEQRTTDESHVAELSYELKESLKKCPIVLSYVCFNSLSKGYIIDELSKLGINNVDIFFHNDLSAKVFDDKSSIFADSTQRELVKSKLSDIGYKIIKSEKSSDKWDDERLRKAALGYNDAQQMVIFDVNVPTYTILPFWFNGKYNDINWRGLFQRTDNSLKSMKS